MSFMRPKTIKGHTYYYQVSNHRVNGKVVQKFEKYFGKNPQNFIPGKRIETTDKAELVKKAEEEKNTKEQE